MITTVKNDIDFNIDNELIDVNEFINITHNEDISFNTHNEDISFNIHNEDISFNIHNENYLNEFESYLSDKETAIALPMDDVAPVNRTYSIIPKYK
jgi:hypothetical protein